MDINEKFIEIINQSYKKYLETGSRSNQKLYILHGFISKTISENIDSKFTIKSLGFENCNEGYIEGKYYKKHVDILIEYNNMPVMAIAIKFVMSNYVQNANNYFESMLGETINIKAKEIPYFQVIVLIENLPYFDKNGNIKKIEQITNNHLDKYVKLSQTNDKYLPDYTLLYIMKMNFDMNNCIKMSKIEFKKHIDNDINSVLIKSIKFNKLFQKKVILNDFNEFIKNIKIYLSRD